MKSIYFCMHPLHSNFVFRLMLSGSMMKSYLLLYADDMSLAGIVRYNYSSTNYVTGVWHKTWMGQKKNPWVEMVRSNKSNKMYINQHSYWEKALEKFY